MIIKVTDDYEIRSDASAWTVHERRIAGEGAKVPGEVTWTTLTYHPTLESAGRSLAQYLMRTCERTTRIDNAIQTVRELNRLVAESVEFSEELWK